MSEKLNKIPKSKNFNKKKKKQTKSLFICLVQRIYVEFSLRWVLVEDS